MKVPGLFSRHFVVRPETQKLKIENIGICYETKVQCLCFFDVFTVFNCFLTMLWVGAWNICSLSCIYIYNSGYLQRSPGALLRKEQTIIQQLLVLLSVSNIIFNNTKLKYVYCLVGVNLMLGYWAIGIQNLEKGKSQLLLANIIL